MKKVQSFIFALTFLMIGLSSCEKEVIEPIQTTHIGQITTASTDLFVPDGHAFITISEVGTIMKQGDEYVIHAQGKTYIPNDLSEEYQAHKLRVQFVGTVQESEIGKELIPMTLVKITASERPIDLPRNSTRVEGVNRITN